MFSGVHIIEVASTNSEFNGCLTARTLTPKEKKDNKMEKITVHTNINASLEEVWRLFTTPADVEQWNTASEDWHTTTASNELQVGGKFNYRMEAKDGSFGFDFWGTYDRIIDFKQLEYTLGDGRKVSIIFKFTGIGTKLTEIFETEDENPVEMQQFGWQAILDNFKKYVEDQQ